MKRETAILAGGCFWGIQAYFDQVPGVISTEVGYIGGHSDQPTYEQVCSHTTGHAEAVKIDFDPEKVSYETLLRHFFNIHDPTQLNRQGWDIGDSYRSAIFTSDENQTIIAKQASEAAQAHHKKPIVTEITPETRWWPAEDYHQKYAKKTGRGGCHVPYQPLT